MKRSTRYRIAKLNRASTEFRYFLRRCVLSVWLRVMYPQQWKAAVEMIERDRAASRFYA